MSDARLVLAATGLLREFNDAGVLAPADVHVARRLAELAGEGDEAVQLAAALAVRGPRLGHVCVDLATIRATATVDVEEPVDLSALPWPDPDEWLERVGRSGLIGPLRLEGSVLYLDRYWREERRVASDLLALMDAAPASVDEARMQAGLTRIGGDTRQRRAAETALRRRFAVVAGGPGTGKTTTVAHILALLFEQSDPLVALAAPTGKAAARLVEAVHEEARRLDVAAEVRERVLSLDASTLHRLLGWRPDSHSRFRHDSGNRLPYDVVIVDETSMVSLSLMARLIEAVRPDARLILVGDPGQLASIEAGAVLGDIVRPGEPGIVVLERVHRFGEGIAMLADAVRRGDSDAVIAVLEQAPPGVTWLPVDVAATSDLAPVRERAVEAASTVIEAAGAGEAARAIEALGAFRVLC